VSNFGASPFPFIAAADPAPEMSVDPASINVALAEEGSIAAEYHGIFIHSGVAGSTVDLSIAGTVQGGVGYDAINAYVTDADFTLTLHAGWELIGDAVVNGASKATLELAGDKDSALDLSRLRGEEPMLEKAAIAKAYSGPSEDNGIIGITDLVKSGESIFVLTGAAADDFAGFSSAEVTAGTLSLDGATVAMAESANAMSVGAKGTLRFARGSEVQGDLVNNGNVVVGAGNVGTVRGNFTDAGGTLRIGAASPTDFGKLAVEGTATFTDDAHIDVDTTGSDFNLAAAGNTMRGVISAGTLVSNGFEVTDNSVLFNFVAHVDEDDLNQVNLNIESPLDGVQRIARLQGNFPGLNAAGVIDEV